MSRGRPFLSSVLAALLVGCASDPARHTLAELHSVKPDVADLEVSDSLDLAMQSYRRFLDQTPTGAMTPEAMRRLADLELEKEYGIVGNQPRTLPAPADSFAPLPVRAPPRHPQEAPPQPQESDEEFEKRATQQIDLATTQDAHVDLPGAENLPQSGPREAIAIYQRLLKEYPSYERSDQVIYQMARAYDELGETEQAMAAMQRLIDEYGYSKYIDEVDFRRGEYFFTRAKYRDAEAAYQAITTIGPRSDFYELALYKLGWTLYKQEFYEEALQQYIALLDYKLSTGYDFDAAHEEEDERRVADTFRVISLSFSNLGGPEVVQEYFDTHGNRSYEDRIYKNLGEFYFDKLRYNDAAHVYAAFVDRYPFHKVSPSFSMRMIEIYDAGDFPQLVLESKKQFASRYGLQAEYWRHFDPAERPDVLKFLKTNLTDLASYYHSLYQNESLADQKSANYSEALVWYRAFLASFPHDDESPGINYHLADLLLENKDYAQAALEYERTAYEYPTHERSAEAGYAAVYAHREQLKSVAPDQQSVERRATVDSSLKFADAFPDHKEAPAVLGAAAEDLYAMKDYAPAVAAGRKLIERYPAAPPDLRRSSWTVVAHSSLELADYKAAEEGYVEVLKLTPPDDKDRPALVDNLAASIYKQGEQANQAGDYATAAQTFLRIKEAAPTSTIRPNAEYDAGMALIHLQDWTQAAKVLDDFRTTFPNHELQPEATKQLAFVYRQSGQATLAAGEYERVAAESTDANLQRDALLTAADLYLQDGRKDNALAAYEHYVHDFPQPVEPALETRYKIAGMYKDKGDQTHYVEQLQQIVDADAHAGADRTDRTRYLAAQSALVLAEPLYTAFEQVKLVQPFQESLKRKRSLMDAALQAFEKLTEYEVGDVTAAATYYMAETYGAFSRALMESERPTGLDTAARADYEDALEEQAFPFEERSIKVHEKNRELVSTGIYNSWVEKSFARLAELVPGRYAKPEKSFGLIRSLESAAYRIPAAGAAPSDESTAVTDKRSGGNRRSRADKDPTERLEIADGVGFTFTEQRKIDTEVRTEYDSAISELDGGRYDSGIPKLTDVVSRAPELVLAYVDLGIAYAQKGDLDNAASTLEKAVQLNAADPIAYNELGLIYRRQGRFTLARQTYEKGLAAYADFDPTRKNLAILCDLYLADQACALQNYEAYQALVPDDAQVSKWIADLSGRTNPSNP